MKPVDADALAVQLERHRPWLKGEGKAILDYVDNYSGGSDPISLQEIEDFGKSLKNKRMVGTQQVRLLGSLKLSAAPTASVSNWPCW